MQLFGSTTSPFVRRLRLYLVEHEYEYEFINLDIFSAEGRKILLAKNPALKVPALIDNDENIFDSRVIYRYLSQKFGETPLTWSQENLLSLIDAANDSFVNILILTRSQFDTTQDNLFSNLQNERIATVLAVLEQEVSKGSFLRWQYPAICLFCLLDWVEFRQLYDIEQFPNLSAFCRTARTNKGVKETDPR